MSLKNISTKHLNTFKGSPLAVTLIEGQPSFPTFLQFLLIPPPTPVLKAMVEQKFSHLFHGHYKPHIVLNLITQHANS